MELQVHLRQRLPHVLNVGRGVVQQPFPLAQIGSQNRNLALRLETAAQQAVGVQSLEPLDIADVGLAARNVLGIAGVDQQHLEAALIKDLESRDPVDAGGFHDNRLHPAFTEPVGKAVQIAGERAEAAHRLGAQPGSTAAICIVAPMSIAAASG